jgi:hypothetical protein
MDIDLDHEVLYHVPEEDGTTSSDLGLRSLHADSVILLNAVIAYLIRT